MTDKLTPEQISEFKETFSKFDKDEDGTLSVSEFGAIMRSAGLNPTPTELVDWVNEFDQTGSGTVDFSGFLALMSIKLKEEETKKDMKEMFLVFDKNGDGFISRDELSLGFKSLGEELSDKDIDDIITEGDVDGDGKLSFDEFRRIYMTSCSM